MESLKTCVDCGRSWPIDNFPKDGKKTRPCCRPCYSDRRYGPKFDIDAEEPAKDESEDFEELIRLTRKPIGFSELCNRLDVSPARLKERLQQARSKGLLLQVASDKVGIHSEPVATIQDVVPPTVGERQTIAVISDTHLGSKYCLRAQLREFIFNAYSIGVREILHPGDWLDGCYRHGLWEVSHSGLEAQVDDLAETLPRLQGLSYHGITGNHDFTFTEANGVDVGRFIVDRFRALGRNDIRFYGDRGATLKIRGATVDLWHPKKGSAYAVSYGLQKRIEAYSSGQKPQVLLTGHWHRCCYIYERGIHAIACPTFQGGGSAFGKSLGGSPAIGGLILSWDLTEHGTVRGFRYENRAYFEREIPQAVANE